MRILYNSKDLQFKDPFGTLIPGQSCRLCIHIPATVQPSAVECLLESIDGVQLTVPLHHALTKGAYQQWQGEFSLQDTGLYFYFFRIHAITGPFRLWKQEIVGSSAACLQISLPPIGPKAPPSTKSSPTVFAAAAAAT